VKSIYWSSLIAIDGWFGVYVARFSLSGKLLCKQVKGLGYVRSLKLRSRGIKLYSLGPKVLLAQEF